MVEALSYPFMQHALIAAVLISIVAGVIGSLAVVNRMVFLVGGIAHAAYGGIGLSIFFSVPMFLSTAAVTALASLVMAHYTLYRREHNDLLVGIIWAVGMASGIILVDLTPGYTADLMSYLFGSILAIERSDLWGMSALLLITLGVITLRYRAILAVSYDSEYARLLGINVRFYYSLILLLCGLSVVVAMKIVGLIMVIAMLTIPVYMAQKIAKSLLQMMLFSALFALISSLIGLWLAYMYSLSSGAAIILVATALMGVFELGRVLWHKR
ncbi:MAG: metal ABC transporter permease [Campylobacterales bacterium]|nr:metal ABC transporter permease [Campylobacterales bacterium]